MHSIIPHRKVVASSLTPASAQHCQQQQINNEHILHHSSEYILSVASSSASPSHECQSSFPSSSSSSEGCFVAAALSDKSIVFYDIGTSQNDGNNNNGSTIIHRIEKAHEGPISEIEFFPSSTTSFISAGQDGYVKVWDLRCRTCTIDKNPSLVMKLALPNEKALCVSLGYGGTLAAVGTDKARISFFDLRYVSMPGNTSTSHSTTSTHNHHHHRSGELLASYVDAHTEEVTSVRFQTTTTTTSSSSSFTSTVSSPPNEGGKTVLASASEDGLIAIHDPSQPTEESALLSVLNIGTPIRNMGFFGPNYEGMYALTGSESMSVHHWDSGQRICDVGGGLGLRDVLSDVVVRSMNDDGNENNNRMKKMKMSTDDNYGGIEGCDDGNSIIEYLVGCTWAPQIPSRSSVSMSSIPSFPSLHLLAGSSEGDGYLFQVDADRITPLMHLRAGHEGCIRDFSWIHRHDGNHNYRLLVTGGEDATLCEWDVYGAFSTINDSCHKSAHHNENSSRKKKFGSPL